MLQILALTIPVAIGAIAWLYQKAWERQADRMKRYEEIIDRLPGFTVEDLDFKAIDAALSELRRLWIFGPDEAVRAGNAFVATIEKGPQPDHVKERALAEFILAMRRDASIWSALFLGVFPTRLSPDEIKLKRGRRE